MEEILDVIMESNFSKLDQDGNPSYDERGKVLKGPNYWKPEPKIKEILKKKLEEQTFEKKSFCSGFGDCTGWGVSSHWCI